MDGSAELKDCLEELYAEEETYRDRIPENLQGGERYEKADEACDSLSSAVDAIGWAIDEIDEANGEMEAACEK